MVDRPRPAASERSEEVLENLFQRYRRLQRYVGWTDSDGQLVRDVGAILEPAFTELIDDFYDALQAEPAAARVLTGGQTQVDRLKVTLHSWLRELFSGRYDRDYVAGRWRVGWRHVDIGLEQIYTNAALSRLRQGLIKRLEDAWTGSQSKLSEARVALSRLLDLDLAIIEDAYQTEYLKRRSEAVFRSLVEAAGCLIVIVHGDHKVAYFNPCAEELTGYRAGDVTGKDFLSVLLPESEREGLAKSIAEVLTGIPARDYENTVLCRDGSQRQVVWNARRIESFEGQAAVLVVGQDITQRKVAEERALQAERLAAIGQTVTGLAHESRNAFQRSQACLELLSLELEGRPEELELVSRTQRALDHLHRLYEEVRDYAAPIKLDRQLCDLAHLWRDAWSQLDVLRQENDVRLQEDADGLDLSCHVDWFAIGQVFRNVLENALMASPNHGEIRVACRQTHWENKPAICVSVRDEGPGIPRGERRQVFEAFFTTKTKGTGLGMAIARRIVEAHGGQIEIGVPESGAEFHITLPRDG